MVAYVFVSGFV